MTNGWDIATAVGTAGSAIFVAFQAFYTRRAIIVSHAAIQPAQTVAIEATRARMDIGAPNLRISLHIEQNRYLVQSSTTGGFAQPVVAGQEWHFPGRAGEPITLQVVATVANLGNESARVSFYGPIRQHSDTEPQPSPPAPMMIEPNQEIVYYIEAKFTAEQWAENWRTRQQNNDTPHFGIVTIECRDQRDQGVTDTWHLRLTGCPIEPTPSKDALWRQTRQQPGADSRDDAVVSFDPDPPRKRTYWISRSRNVALPLPTYDPRA